MKRKKHLSILIFTIFSLLIFNCKKTTESENNWGNADFTTFVAIGNSLTAGVVDGALYEAAQKNSFPNLIAKMAEVDNDFEQPLMSGNGFSFNENDGRFSLNLATFSIDILSAGKEENRNLNRPYNNLGIPLIRANQLYTVTTSVEADSNHFVDKILRGSGRTAIEEALFLDPTLITLWVGNNDVLESAALGFADGNYTYTEPNDFAIHLNNIVNELTNNTDAPIFIANVFDITDLPYFTSLPSLVKNPLTGESAYLFGECENGVRQLTDDDLILFWALPKYFNFRNNISSISETTALNDTLILDVEEKLEIQDIINQYNDIIEDIANSNNQLNLIDIYSIFKGIADNGYELSGTNYTNNLISFDTDGNINLNLVYRLFGVDALHPNSFGYASIANSFIDVINSSLNADLPLVTSSDL